MTRSLSGRRAPAPGALLARGRKRNAGIYRIPDIRTLRELWLFASSFQAVGLDLADGNASQPSEFRAATPSTTLAPNSGLPVRLLPFQVSVVMKGTKIFWGQVLLVGAVVLAFIWAATEWTAWRLAFQPELGAPLVRAVRLAALSAAGLLLVVVRLRCLCPEIFVEGAYIAASGAIAAIVVAVAMAVWRAREAKSVTTYGSARWAESREIRHAGLFHAEGVVLGRWRGATFAMTVRSTCLLRADPQRQGRRPGGADAADLAGLGYRPRHQGRELGLTAGWRRVRSRLLFDPTNAASAAYNPLLEVRRGAWEVRDVQNIADVLVDPEGALERRNHWEKTSHALLVGAILHVLYAETDKTLAGVANFLSDPNVRSRRRFAR